MKDYWEITVQSNRKVLLRDLRNGSEQVLSVSLRKPVWAFRMKLLEQAGTGIPWDRSVFLSTDDDGKTGDQPVDDTGMAIVYLERGQRYRLRILPEPLSVTERVNLLRHLHAGGRWREAPAEAIVNATGDLAILWRTCHDVDYMFSESVDTQFWLYDLTTMREVRIRKGDLRYRYHDSASGKSVSGLSDMRFDPGAPHRVLLTYVAADGGEQVERVFTFRKK